MGSRMARRYAHVLIDVLCTFVVYAFFEPDFALLANVPSLYIAILRYVHICVVHVCPPYCVVLARLASVYAPYGSHTKFDAHSRFLHPTRDDSEYT